MRRKKLKKKHEMRGSLTPIEMQSVYSTAPADSADLMFLLKNMGKKVRKTKFVINYIFRASHKKLWSIVSSIVEYNLNMFLYFQDHKKLKHD